MIRVQELTKYYGGKRALGPVSFEIADGETVGFLGLNGAGKTTALRILACDLRPSSGTITVGKTDAIANPHEIRKQIGFLPENPPVYGEMSVVDYLAFAAELRGMNKSSFRSRLPDVLSITHLTDVSNEIISQLSHGYRQRVGVAQAIIHQPKLLILDEPTRGLDPVQIVEMRSMIRALKDNYTVLISSHILTEIAQTCDRLMVLGNGQILGSGSQSELSAANVEVKHVHVLIRTDDAAAAKTVLEAVEGVTAVVESLSAGGGTRFDVSSAQDLRAELCRAIVGAGLDLLKLDYAQSELESTFIGLVQGGIDARN